VFEWVETGSGRCFAIAVVNGQNVPISLANEMFEQIKNKFVGM